jgi:diaminohydroxyphosphoribosylaminopyrimidine deaminase/5-amino-6-(5-phosphoribosylamino)uracil reductase
MVGCVIVSNGEIIGEGWHYKAGQAHAEVNAINAVKNEALLKKSTLYVSLEPCSHFGKTPPCANLIISKKIPQVVVACRDAHSKVNGQGIRYLQQHGVKVTEGVLKKEAEILNHKFFTFHVKQRPYILLKWAQSLDGFIDKERSSEEKGINWITQPLTRTYVHQLRAEQDAILIGAQTAINDNPSLTVREVKPKNITRIVIDPNLRVPASAAVFKDEDYLIFSKKSSDRKKVVTLKESDFSLATILKHCYHLGLQSILVEGGAATLQSFIEANLWDEAQVLVGQTTLGKGLKAPLLNKSASKQEHLGKDLILKYKNA